MLNSDLENIIFSYLDLNSYSILYKYNPIRYSIDRYEKIYVHDLIKIRDTKFPVDFCEDNIKVSTSEYLEILRILFIKGITKTNDINKISDSNRKSIQKYMIMAKMYEPVISFITQILFVLKDLDIIDADIHITHVGNKVQFIGTFLPNLKIYECDNILLFTIKRDYGTFYVVENDPNLYLSFISGSFETVVKMPLTPIFKLLGDNMRLLVSLNYRDIKIS